jgi:hypothetical protein
MTVVTDKPAAVLEDGVSVLTGALTSHTVGGLEKTIARMKQEASRSSTVRVWTVLDTSGAVFVNRIAAEGEIEKRGFDDNALKLMNLAAKKKPEEIRPPDTKPRVTLESIGNDILKRIDTINEIAVLIVDILFWSVVGIFKRDQYRKGTYSEQAIHMGSTALPSLRRYCF